MVFHILLSMVRHLTLKPRKNETDFVDQAEIGGAQEPSVFEQVFAQLEKRKESAVKVDGDVCLPDGSNC